MENTIKYKRNPNTGLLDNVTYIYNDMGLIDWRKMIPDKYFYILKENIENVESKYCKKISDLKISEIEDKYLQITLSGLRYLATLRGFISVTPKVENVVYDPSYQIAASCTVTCNIKWIGNFETGMQPVEYGDVAGASMTSTDAFVKKYIETVAMNRAFCRAVRGFLNISVVSKDEVGPNVDVKEVEQKEPTSAGVNPIDLLEKQLKERKWSFELFQRAIVKNHKDKIKNSDPEKWESLKDIPKNDIFTILGLLPQS
jgi:hypothetical protein